MAGWDGEQQLVETVPLQIGEILNVTVDNVASNGAVIPGDSNSLVASVKATSMTGYDLIMLRLGTNDWGNQTESLDDMKQGLDYFKQQLQIQNPNAKAFYELPMEQFGWGSTSLDDKNRKGLSQNDVINFLKNYAISNGWGYYDWRPDPLITYDNRMQTTGDNGWGHPTQAIMAKMAQRLATAIKPYLNNANQPTQPSQQPTQPSKQPVQPTVPSDDSGVLSKMNQYNFIFFGFDPKDESSSNQWAATPAMCGSNDGIHWQLIDEFPQLGNLRDGNLAKYGNYYWITGTAGLYRTTDFKSFQSFDCSVIFNNQNYKNIWAPEFFTDLNGNWHLVWGAVSDSRHIYVADFDPNSGAITNAWQPVNEDHGMDPHIWTIGSRYYLSIDAYWLYDSDSYLGPFKIINSNIPHNGNGSRWHEAGETLIDGDTIYLYVDYINQEVSGVKDSGHMVVRTAKTNNLSNWSGEQRVISDINMRHGSFLNMKNSSKNTQPTSPPYTPSQPTSVPQPSVPAGPVGFQLIKDYTQISSVTKSNYSASFDGLNSIYQKLSRLIGDDYPLVRTIFTSNSSMLNRATWLFVVHVVDHVEQEVNEAVSIFRANDLVDIKTGNQVEYLDLDPPTRLLLDNTYQQTLNGDWTAVQNKINEMLGILKQFHL